MATPFGLLSCDLDPSDIDIEDLAVRGNDETVAVKLEGSSIARLMTTTAMARRTISSAQP
jgi:hypothetical protein